MVCVHESTGLHVILAIEREADKVRPNGELGSPTQKLIARETRCIHPSVIWAKTAPVHGPHRREETCQSHQR